jgi:hypothetical protein
VRRIENFLAPALAVAAVGCSLPLAVWPEFPAGYGRTLRVETPDGAPAYDGFLLLRIFQCDGAGVAEGDRSLRNEQALGQAFDYRRAVRVHVKPGTRMRYRLADLQMLPIATNGEATLPAAMHAGSLWVIVDQPKAREGVHSRRHFAEVQAILPGRPPSAHAEVGPVLESLRVEKEAEPVAWRQELEHARADLERLRPEAYSTREFLDAELARLRERFPAAFVPDGVAVLPAGEPPPP